MSKAYLFLIVLFATFSVFGQNSKEKEKQQDTLVIDPKYREDQFYASVTYNLLINKPKYIKQSGFSGGFHLGFIRDMPINTRRNVSIGVGIGLSSNSYNQNILIQRDNGEIIYGILDGENFSYSKNTFTNYLLEVPIEFRWRTSTMPTYDFWRIYPGMKFGYVIYDVYKFRSDIGDFTLKNNSDTTKFQYGLTLSVGYSTINFNFYYGLNKLFSDVDYGGSSLDLSSLEFGLMFYIL